MQVYSSCRDRRFSIQKPDVLWQHLVKITLILHPICTPRPYPTLTAATVTAISATSTTIATTTTAAV